VRQGSSAGAVAVFAIFDGEGDNPHPRYRRGRVWNCLRFLAASIVRANSLGTHQSERNPLSFRAPPPSSLPRFAQQWRGLRTYQHPRQVCRPVMAVE